MYLLTFINKRREKGLSYGAKIALHICSLSVPAFA